MRLVISISLLLSLSLLSGCSYLVSFSPGRLMAPEDNERVFKVGKPYQVAGKWYYPKEDVSYDKVGYASWYGPDFHGNDTANGEVFNKYALTAAHKTLPMPSIVKVTNLENGRWVKVRINDRGPFVNSRIIDVSREAAKKLGFLEKGTTKVRVQYLKKETAELFPADSPVRPENRAYAAVPVKEVKSASLIPEAEANTVVPNKKTLAKASYNKPQTQRKLVSRYAEEKEKKGLIFVQAASFNVREKAETSAKRLRQMGKVAVINNMVNGQNFYRVRLGPLKDSKAADRILSKVEDYGFKNAFIVTD